MLLLPLLLLLACARLDAATEPGGGDAVLSSLATQKDLLIFAVRNYNAWQLVWKQKVRPTELLQPPYRDHDDGSGWPTSSTTTRNALLLLAANDEGHVEPFAVVRGVLNHFAWLGSYVEYAVRILRAAVSCLTAQYVWLQLGLLVLSAKKMMTSAPELQSTEEPTGTVRLTETLTAVCDALHVYADKLAATSSDMKPMAEVSFRLNRLITEKPADSTDALTLLLNEMEQSVDKRCVKVTPEELYKHFGDPEGYTRLHGDETTWVDVADVVRTVVIKSVSIFNGLGHETFPTANWRQIFDYKYPIDSGIKLDAVDPLTGSVSP